MKILTSLITCIFLVSALLIGCSPTRFSSVNSIDKFCDSQATSCVEENNVISNNYDELFKVGDGKVDILVINDNSASMSVVQNRIANAFSGFLSNLENKNIDYKIAMSTTDLVKFLETPLLDIPYFSTNGSSKYILRTDIDRYSRFNSSIIRDETRKCEDFIKSAYYTQLSAGSGADFRSTDYYRLNYPIKCPSGDERGIYSVANVINNVPDFIRDDANLNIIIISNEDVRSGLYSINQDFALADADKNTNLINLINTKYPGKYWEFNSIIVKDTSCANAQRNSFKDNSGNTILSNGSYVVDANPGLEYAKLSNSTSLDVDGNPTTRGQVLSICDSNYATYFTNVAAKIADSSRLKTLKCVPSIAPVIEVSNNPNATVPYEWNPGSDKILFKKGSEGINIRIKYKCSGVLVQ